MASRGFEFAYCLDGRNNGTPTIKDWAMAADASGYAKGDALVVDSNGRAVQATSAATAIAFVCQETDTSSIANDTELKVAVVLPSQVWKCSMDASSTTIKKVYTKTVQLVDHNTIDANGTSAGCMALVDVSDLDDDGNILAYVVFKSQIGGHS